MEQEIIQTCKDRINNNDMETLQDYFQEIIAYDNLDWPVIFHRVYLHACLKGREQIAEWMQTHVHPLMDPIQQIALRQIFSYGRTLIAKAKRLEEIKRGNV